MAAEEEKVGFLPERIQARNAYFAAQQRAYEQAQARDPKQTEVPSGEMLAAIMFTVEQKKQSTGRERQSSREKPKFQRTDFRLMDDVRSGYGGKGFAPSDRFFRAMEEAKKAGYIKQEGKLKPVMRKEDEQGYRLHVEEKAIGISYKLTPKGRKLYDKIKDALPSLKESLSR